MLGRHLGQSAGRTLRLWPVLALSLAALLGAALAANTASPLSRVPGSGVRVRRLAKR